LEQERDAAVRCSARLCENSLAAQHGKKSTLTFWLWRIFIFSESDLNHFLAFQNDRI
jgi:hypothetical protein